jgi:hypothetical protein
MNNLGARGAWWRLAATVAAVACSPSSDEVSRIVVMPGSVLVAVGDTVLLRAEVRDRLDHATGAVPEAWASADSAVATVSPGGVVMAHGKGTTAITASLGHHVGNAAIDVVAESADLPSLSRDVQPILSANCALSGRHVGPMPSGGLNLVEGATFESTVNVAAAEFSSAIRVVPYYPHFSFLLRELQREARGIPPNMPHVHRDVAFTQEEMHVIRAWIRAGARNN